MKQNKTIWNPGWVTLLMIVLVGCLQVWVVPALRSVWNGQLSIYLTVCVVALYLVALFPLCRGAKGSVLPDAGQASPWLGVTAVMAGMCLLVTNAGYAYIWATRGVTPPPFSAIFNEVDHISLVATLICGVLGGAVLADIGIRWLAGRSVRTLSVRWMTILPVLWAFARLIRYTESYTSTIRNSFSFPNAAMLILTIGFMLQLGRHLLGRGGEGQARSLAVVAFGTAVMGISTPLLRILLTRFWPAAIADVVQMADASDFGIGLLSFAVGWYLCSPAAEVTAEPETEKPTEPEATIPAEPDVNQPAGSESEV